MKITFGFKGQKSGRIRTRITALKSIKHTICKSKLAWMVKIYGLKLWLMCGQACTRRLIHYSEAVVRRRILPSHTDRVTHKVYAAHKQPKAFYASQLNCKCRLDEGTFNRHRKRALSIILICGDSHISHSQAYPRMWQKNSATVYNPFNVTVCVSDGATEAYLSLAHNRLNFAGPLHLSRGSCLT